MSNETTPGPWKWFNDGDLANADGRMVLRPDANRGVPTDADAALIAAAPELLEACKKALPIIRECAVWEERNAALDAVYDVLQKLGVKS